MKARNSQCRPTTANEGQRRPATANAGQQSQQKPTQASPPQPRRTLLGIFFPLHNRLCLLTYVIIKFLGSNDVVDIVNIVVIVYVDSEFLTMTHQHPDTHYKKPVG